MNTILLKSIPPFLLSLVITAILIPAWINLCSKWKLFDKPDSRKHHTAVVPTLGGIAIFAGFIISFLVFNTFESSSNIQFIIAASFILFFTGFFDDLTDIPAKRKLIIQIITASFVITGGLRIESLNGLFGINEISLAAQFLLTAFVILFITNAYNFIDGLDGLATSIGIFVLSIFSVLFFINGETNFGVMCVCMIGSLIAFLFFNFHPAKIFMGDTGSLVVGFIISICCIKLFSISGTSNTLAASLTPSLIIGALFVLIFDLTRVVFIRVFNGISPFKADRSHLHHMVCRQEFGHRGATTILIMFNLFFTALVFVFRNLATEMYLLICFCLAILLINSKVISIIAMMRNKIVGEPKKKLGINSPV